MCLCCTFLSAQIYVNASATGAGDGSSWADAYTSLSDAIANTASDGSIWVAAGIYNPPSPELNVDTAFVINQNLSLYGGFAGNESSLDERDPSANKTILSADQMGDDFFNDFTNNREDNNRHVIFVTDNVTEFVLDGFTVSNGNAEGEDGTGNTRRASGILTYGKVLVNNCKFTANYAYYGAALYCRGDASAESVITNCDFSRNRSGWGGAGVYLLNPSATIDRCSFDNNFSERLGGAIYNRSELGSMITNCSFEENIAETSRGGAIYNQDSPSTIMGCEFIENSAFESTAGAIKSRVDDEVGVEVVVNIIGCSFEGNEARWGGAVGTYDSLAVTVIDNCEFIENKASSSGGCITNGFGAKTEIKNTSFELNEAESTGGAIYSQNDWARIEIDNCRLEENTSSTGGAINMSGSGDVGNDVSELTMTNSVVVKNIAAIQGGGINLNNANANIASVLVAQNVTAEPTSIGSGISINSGDTTQVYIRITNSTIADNEGSEMAGIAQFTGDVDGFSQLTLQNTILANDQGNNWTLESGTPTVVSGGGNLVTDISLEQALDMDSDQHKVDPKFTYDTGAEYQVRGSSPAVDAGVMTGAPLLDILGLPRVGAVDIGAYENQNPLSASFESVDGFGMSIFPNPVAEQLNLTLRGHFSGDVLVTVQNMAGQQIWSGVQVKTRDAEHFGIDLGSIEAGQYILIVRQGDYQSSQAFHKI